MTDAPTPRDVLLAALLQSKLRASEGFLPDEEDADAILSALTTAGWAVVPREPTPEMWRRSADALVKDPHGAGSGAHHDHISGIVWGAMIAAATPGDGE